MRIFNRFNKNFSQVVHLINPMINPNGGSERRTIELYKIISRVSPVQVWSDRRFSSELAHLIPIKRIFFPFSYPQTGTFVFVGAYFKIKSWIKRSKPSRIIVIYNTPQPEDIQQFLESMNVYGLRNQIEIVYAAEWMKGRTGLPGVVQQSPIDLLRFSPHPNNSTSNFTIGRLSRDVIDKHHPDDPKFWIAMADRKIKIRLMGATCIKNLIPSHQFIELLPSGAKDAAEFLNSLDVFVFRANNSWFEPFGRVVYEAMACGLPVVCGYEGGYRESIKHGENGFLFTNNEEAMNIIIELKNNPELRTSIGKAARMTVEQLFSKEEMNKQAVYYTSK